MIAVSDAWKDVQQRFLLPETFIEIEYGVADKDAQGVASASGTDQAFFSNVAGVVGTSAVAKYATNELNLWALDGSRTLLPSSGAYSNVGYVSNIASTGSVTISFPAIRTTAISGLTITWGETFDEYPRVFTVIGRNGENIVSEVTVTNNKDKVSAVFIQLANYDSVTVIVHDWNLPYRRARIEKIVIGHALTFTKSDLLSFTHEQNGDLLSGEIPKYSISFSLDNSDGRWDPNNPAGMAQYLSERQKLSVRYGLDVNGTIEWIKGGVFYLSEWSAPPNGIEAHFVARDGFEFMIGVEMWAAMASKVSYMVTNVTRGLWPNGSSVTYDASLNDYMMEYSPSYTTGDVDTAASIVQKCANAVCAIMRCDRDGNLFVEPLNKTLKEYMIPLSLSYSYPEISLSKPLKEVSVDYGGDQSSYKLSVSDAGETQTLTNDYISKEANAVPVATWVADVLKMRRTVSGEFRADPRLELYDVVTVEDRYGRGLKVAITNIKYTFNGAFRGTFTGRVIEEV